VVRFFSVGMMPDYRRNGCACVADLCAVVGFCWDGGSPTDDAARAKSAQSSTQEMHGAGQDAESTGASFGR
jgi:hypothetical protein